MGVIGRIFLVVLLLAILGVSILTYLEEPEKIVEEPEELTMGLSLILTGPIEGSGEPISFGALHYFQYVNEELGGIEYRTADGETGKVKLNIIVADNKYTADKSEAVYELHKSFGVDFMAVFGTTPGMICSPLASADRMPVINFYAMATPDHFAPQPSYCTSGFANIAEHVGLTMKWFKETQWTAPEKPKIGIMILDIPGFRFLDEPAPPAPTTAIMKYADELGVDFLFDPTYSWISVTPTATEITDALTYYYGQSPDMMIVGHLATQMGPILTEAANVGFDLTATPFVAPTFAFDETVIAAAGTAAEGLYGAVIASLPGEDEPGVILARTISERYYDEPLSLLYLEGVFYAMEIVGIIQQALNTVGYDNLTADAINHASHNLTDFDPQGITPEITIDPNYPMLNPWAKIAKVENGVFVPVSDWFQYPAIREFMP